MKDKTDKELIAEAKDLHESIYVTECYGTNDLTRYAQVCGELEKDRGYEIVESRKIELTKIED